MNTRSKFLFIPFIVFFFILSCKNFSSENASDCSLVVNLPESSSRSYYTTGDVEHYRVEIKNEFSGINEKSGLPGQSIAFESLQEGFYLVHAYAYKDTVESDDSLIAESDDTPVDVECGKTSEVSVLLRPKTKPDSNTNINTDPAPSGDPDADSEPDVAGIQTWANLADAVASAEVDATVYIGNTLTATSTITLTKNITLKSLDGKKYTIYRGNFEGSPVYQYLFSTDATATVYFGGTDEGQLIIDGGGGENASNSLIESKGDLWIMENCTLTNNYSSNDGGAITALKSNENCTISIKGKIIGNTTSGSGGAIYAKGAKGSLISLDIYGEISGNTARINGGGICGEFISIQMTYSDSAKISGNKTENSSSGMGGGIYVKGSESVFNMSKGEITGNTATSGNSARGGGIYMNAGTLTVTGGKISGNTSTASNNPGHQITSASGVTYSITGIDTTSGPIDVDITF